MNRLFCLAVVVALVAPGCRQKEACYPLEAGFCEVLGQASCHLRYLCLDALDGETAVACESAVVDSCHAHLVPLLVGLSEAERLRFQGKPAAACLDGLLALTCEDAPDRSRALAWLEASCRGILLGLREGGQSCGLDAECAAGLTCEFTDPDDASRVSEDTGLPEALGTCAARATFGSACSCTHVLPCDCSSPDCDCPPAPCMAADRCLDGQCVDETVSLEGDCSDSLQCVSGTACIETRCKELAVGDAACSDPSHCLSDRYCDQDAGQCTVRLEVGAPCGSVASDTDPCRSSAFCGCPLGDPCADSERVCVSYGNVWGAVCDVAGASCEPEGRWRCDGDTAVCGPWPRLGERCGAETGILDCVGGHCDATLDEDGTCLPRMGYGEACGSDDACAFGRCLLGTCRPVAPCDTLPFWVRPFGGLILAPDADEVTDPASDPT